VTNFVAIGQTIAEIWQFFDFSKMAAVRHLEFVMRMRRAFGGLYHYVKCGWHRCGSFDNLHVLISLFCNLVLKTPIHGNEIVLGWQNGERVVRF